MCSGTGARAQSWFARALTSRLTVVVVVFQDDYVVMGFFWKGELLLLIRRGVGQA